MRPIRQVPVVNAFGKGHYMKRFFVFCVCLGLASASMMGCDSKAKVEKKETVTTPGGTTTTTDEHKVDSSGKNPPANSEGEKAK
jgi:hypothetical protein